MFTDRRLPDVKRRTYLGSAGAGVAALAGYTARGTSQRGSQPEYHGETAVVYDHDDLDLRLRQEAVRLGETAEFEITNTGSSEIVLGCNNPWAVQTYSDGDWRHVFWTRDRYYQLCATILEPGRTVVERVTLTESELEDDVGADLRPGRHRFLLLGPSPFVAVDFDVRDDD